MTKTVRIENADNSNYKVIVEVWENTEAGPVHIENLPADYPTALVQTYITSTRYLVIRENGVRAT